MELLSFDYCYDYREFGVYRTWTMRATNYEIMFMPQYEGYLVLDCGFEVCTYDELEHAKDHIDQLIGRN